MTTFAFSYETPTPLDLIQNNVDSPLGRPDDIYNMPTIHGEVRDKLFNIVQH